MIANNPKEMFMFRVYMTPEEKRTRDENLRKAEAYNRFLNANPWVSGKQEIELFRIRQASKSLSEFLKSLDAFKKNNKR